MLLAVMLLPLSATICFSWQGSMDAPKKDDDDPPPIIEEVDDLR
jgi:hypothetical protein